MAVPKKITYDLLDESLKDILSELETPSPYVHNHDDRYFTETEMNILLAAKAAINHNHDLTYYTKTEIGTLLELKASIEHTHDYATMNHNHDSAYYLKNIVDTKLLNKAEASHSHDAAYYTKGQVDEKVDEAKDDITQLGTDKVNKTVIGDLDELETSDKSSIVGAINSQSEEVILARTSGIKDKMFSNLTDRLEEMEQDSKLHSINNMPHQFKNLQTNKTYQFGFQISSDGKPQIIYEEVI